MLFEAAGWSFVIQAAAGDWLLCYRRISGLRAPEGVTRSSPAVHVPSQPCPAGVVPESCELHLLVVIGDELGDEAEVGNLCSGPAKLEDDNEGPVVEEGSPLRCGCPTAQAGAEDEREGEQNADGACGWAE